MRRAWYFLVAALAAGVLPASPALAHTVVGVRLSNYQSRLIGVVPDNVGVKAKVLETGNRLEVTNTSGKELLILGYDKEPFLQIGPRGVFQNLNSPTTYRSSSRTAAAEVPARANPDKEPEWQRLRTGRTAAWYDHRIHYITEEYPAKVKENPDKVQVVREWTVPMRLGDQAVDVKGDLAWIPPGVPVTWIALGVAMAVGVVAVSRAVDPVRAVFLVLAVTIAVDAFDAVLLSLAVGQSGQFIPSVAFVVMAYFFGGAALKRLYRGERSGLGIALICGAAIAFLGGFSSLFVLFRSQFPVPYSVVLARFSTVSSFVLGTGTALLAYRAIKLTRGDEAKARAKGRRRATT